MGFNRQVGISIVSLITGIVVSIFLIYLGVTLGPSLPNPAGQVFILVAEVIIYLGVLVLIDDVWKKWHKPPKEPSVD